MPIATKALNTYTSKVIKVFIELSSTRVWGTAMGMIRSVNTENAPPESDTTALIFGKSKHSTQNKVIPIPRRTTHLMLKSKRGNSNKKLIF